MPRAPSIFLAHGGPPTLYDVDHAAYKHWKTVASQLRTLAAPGRTNRLRGIVMVSAHWQAGDGTEKPTSLSPAPVGPRELLINSNVDNPLIYDFYGFPKHFYDAKMLSRAEPWLVELVRSTLDQTWEDGATTLVNRGPDHGVWVPLLAGFGEEGLVEAGLPLVQVSLPRATLQGNDAHDVELALELGKALRPLRDQGIAVIGGGQPVHNLREFIKNRGSPNPPTPEWAREFPKHLGDILRESGDGQGGEDKRWKKLTGGKERKGGLLQRPEYKPSHPTSEHFLPIAVALGAAHPDEAAQEQVPIVESGLAWHMYSWGV